MITRRNALLAGFGLVTQSGWLTNEDPEESNRLQAEQQVENVNMQLLYEHSNPPHWEIELRNDNLIINMGEEDPDPETVDGELVEASVWFVAGPYDLSPVSSINYQYRHTSEPGIDVEPSWATADHSFFAVVDDLDNVDIHPLRDFDEGNNSDDSIDLTHMVNDQTDTGEQTQEFDVSEINTPRYLAVGGSIGSDVAQSMTLEVYDLYGTNNDGERVFDVEYNEEPLWTDNDEDNGGAGILFRQAADATDNTLLLASSGATTVGLSYLAYRNLKGDNKSKTAEETTITSQEEKSTPTRAEPLSSLLSVDHYDDLDIGECVNRNSTVKINQATVGDDSVWVLTPESGDETIDSSQFDAFLSQVEPWANMDAHQHLLSVYGHGEEPLPWVAVEPAETPTIQYRAADLRSGEMADYLVQSCEAVHHVQRYGLAYEQLSPESVLVDDTATLRGVLDHATSDELGYELPDSTEDATAEQADVYRLGALAYEVFTGSKPDQPEPTSPSEHNAALSAAVEEVLLKALAERPDDRHETVLHLRDELQDCSDSI